MIVVICVAKGDDTELVRFILELAVKFVNKVSLLLCLSGIARRIESGLLRVSSDGILSTLSQLPYVLSLAFNAVIATNIIDDAL